VKLKSLTLAMAAAICLPALASNPLYNEPLTGDGRIYKCRSTPEGWYCALVAETDGDRDLDNVDWVELAAATRAAREARLGSPVDACINTHGGSGCCRRISAPLPDGTVYIECG
jgi:hypothetical protein